MNFLTLAKAILPKNSPLMSKVEQAQQIAGQFSPTKSGVLDLIKQYNISQETLQQAIRKLNSPAVSGVLNMVKPGLTDTLNAAARELTQEIPAAGTSGNIPENPGNNVAGGGIDDLRKRLSKF